MRSIRGDAAAEWMVTGNPAAVLSGSSPVDFLTRAGTRGYEALARRDRANFPRALQDPRA